MTHTAEFELLLTQRAGHGHGVPAIKHCYYGPRTLPFVPQVGVSYHFPHDTALEGTIICRADEVEWWDEERVFVCRHTWELEPGESWQDAVDFLTEEGWRDTAEPLTALATSLTD